MEKNRGRCLLFWAMAAAVLAFAASYFQILGMVDGFLADRFYFRPRPADKRIHIIAVDDDTLAARGAFGGWSRSVWAQLVEKLGEQPAVVAFDMIFLGNGDIAGDEAFAQAVTGKNVVVGAQYIFPEGAKSMGQSRPWVPEVFHPPYDALAAVTQQGLVNSTADKDGVVRDGLYALAGMPSLPLAAYKAYCSVTEERERFPRWLNKQHELRIPFVGEPGSFQTTSLEDVLSGAVDPSLFKDSIVLVGAYAEGLQDDYPTGASVRHMYGVEIHANTLQALLEGRGYILPPPLWYALCTAGCVFAGVLLCPRRKNKHLVVLLLLSVGLQLSISVVGAAWEVWLPMIYIPLFMGLLCVGKFSANHLSRKTIAHRK